MATELARIAELSAQNPTMVFTSIAHLINVKLLRDCHEKMDDDKAVGIDGITKLNEILVGYDHYYGITDNLRSLKSFRYEVLKNLFYWVNRRSQKKSYNWANFLKMIDTDFPQVKAKIYVSIYAQ